MFLAHSIVCPNNPLHIRIAGRDEVGSLDECQFGLVFDLPGVPLTNDYAEVIKLTKEFLLSFMYYTYDDALESLTMTDSRTSFSSYQGPKIDFSVSTKFVEDTIEVTCAQIMTQISKSFESSDSFSSHYLDMLHKSLEATNPFQQTSKVYFHPVGSDESLIIISRLSRIRVHSRGKNKTSNIGVAGAFAGAAAILALSGLLIHRRDGHKTVFTGNSQRRQSTKGQHLDTAIVPSSLHVFFWEKIRLWKHQRRVASLSDSCNRNLQGDENI